MSPSAVFRDETLDESTKLLVAAGELDLSVAPELRRRVETALRDGYPQLVIDLSDVRHLDSSALAELIGAHQRFAERHGRVVLVAAAPMIRRTFEIRGLGTLFEVTDSRDNALAAIRG